MVRGPPIGLKLIIAELVTKTVMYKLSISILLAGILTICAVAQTGSTNDRDAELLRRRQAAPSQANHTPLKETLKWLAHEGGTADGGQNELTGPYTFGVKFSACRLSYRLGPQGTQTQSRGVTGIGPLYVPVIIEYRINLADIDPTSISVQPSDAAAFLHFKTIGSAELIKIEDRGGLQFRVTGRSQERERWKSEGKLEIRDRRLSAEFAEAFAYAVTLCSDYK